MSDPLRAAAGRVDRGLYVLFSRHADRSRHDVDRDNHRGAGLSIGFDRYLARAYGVSWLVAAVVGSLFAVLASTGAPGAIGRIVADTVPRLGAPFGGRPVALVTAAVGAGLAKRGTVSAAGAYLRWRSNTRRAAIDGSLPAAVRHMRTLADGGVGGEALLRAVADREVHGESGAAFRRVIGTAALTGSLDTGLRTVARETPSQGRLSPFLSNLRERMGQGPDRVSAFLRTEARLLSRRAAGTDRDGYVELLTELFVLAIALPALAFVAITTVGVLAPSPARTLPLPGAPTARSVLLSAVAGGVLVAGAAAALVIETLRPPADRRRYERPVGVATITTAASNPASAAFAFAFPAVLVGWWLRHIGEPTANAVLFGYVAYALPVGAVAVKRERRDDARDRELRDFVRAVAGRVTLGTSLESAVSEAASAAEFRVIDDDVDDLAFSLGLTTGTAGTDARAEAFDRFRTRLGTPMAARVVGTVSRTVAAGGDAAATFETLQSEVGTLYRDRRRLRSRTLVYVAAAWIAACLVTAVAAGVAAALPSIAGVADAGHAGLDREAWWLYLLAQSTAVSCGWFAGAASRGRYGALLHSAALAALCYAVFAAGGLL